MSDREALRQQIIDKAVVHGKVILSSGREADYYVDLRRVTLDAEAAPLIGRVMRDLTAAKTVGIVEVDENLQLMKIASNLERIADLCTNIGEDVIYMVTGRVIKHSKASV